MDAVDGLNRRIAELKKRVQEDSDARWWRANQGSSNLEDDGLPSPIDPKLRDMLPEQFAAREAETCKSVEEACRDAEELKKTVNVDELMKSLTSGLCDKSLGPCKKCLEQICSRCHAGKESCPLRSPGWRAGKPAGKVCSCSQGPQQEAQP